MKLIPSALFHSSPANELLDGNELLVPLFSQVHLTDCYERMVTEKRQKHESLAWGRRLHLALKAYQEMLLTVHAMGKSKDTVLVNNR